MTSSRRTDGIDVRPSGAEVSMFIPDDTEGAAMDEVELIIAGAVGVLVGDVGIPGALIELAGTEGALIELAGTEGALIIAGAVGSLGMEGVLMGGIAGVVAVAASGRSMDGGVDVGGKSASRMV